jgi:glycerol uptake facilitator-like aquaporin
MAGLTFVLSGGAAILALYGGHGLQRWQVVFVLSLVSALWLVVAVYFLGDISAHFNPATTLAFALRKDMGWVMAGAYWVVQFGAAVCGSLLARAFFGVKGNLAATMPPHGMSWQAAGFEAIITFGLVLMVLNLANGPKVNGPFIPLAVGAYIMAWGTMGGPFDGASMNPARSFGRDVAISDLSTWWVYLIGRSSAPRSPSAWPTCSAVPPRPRRPPPPRAPRSYEEPEPEQSAVTGPLRQGRSRPDAVGSLRDL